MIYQFSRRDLRQDVFDGNTVYATFKVNIYHFALQMKRHLLGRVLAWNFRLLVLTIGSGFLAAGSINKHGACTYLLQLDLLGNRVLELSIHICMRIYNFAIVVKPPAAFGNRKHLVRFALFEKSRFLQCREPSVSSVPLVNVNIKLLLSV